MPISKEHNWFVKNSKKLSEKYPGKYLAIVGTKYVVGNSYLDASKKAEGKFPKKMALLVYMPTDEETVTLL